jgi:hypothetical protein
MWWFTVTVAFLISITFLRKLNLQLSVESGRLGSENYLEGAGGWMGEVSSSLSLTHTHPPSPTHPHPPTLTHPHPPTPTHPHQPTPHTHPLSPTHTSHPHPPSRQSETTSEHLRQLTILVGNFLSYI